MEDKTTGYENLDALVETFTSNLNVNKEAQAQLRARWMEFEKAASAARRAYLDSALGDDTFSKVAGVARKFLPLATKYLGAGGAGALLSNPEGILSVIKGFIG